MSEQTSRSPRYSAPVREMNFHKSTIKSSRARALSPTSVRCFPNEDLNRSLTSSFKPQDPFPSTHSHLTSRRKVGFEPWVGVKNTISRKDMTDEEKESYWLQDEDYERIRRRIRMIIRRVETYSGDPLSSSDMDMYEECKDDIETRENGEYLCSRGLESASKPESLRKKSHRRNSTQRVLIEQEFQFLQGIHDESMIAELYTEVTSSCKFRAVHRAMEDRTAVEEYLGVEN